jgi:hypothetical protein
VAGPAPQSVDAVCRLNLTKRSSRSCASGVQLYASVSQGLHKTRRSGAGACFTEKVLGVRTLMRKGKERAMKKRRAKRAEHTPFGAQVAFARVATGLGWTGLGALAVGASAAGAVAIGALAIRALAVKRGRIQRLDIEELEVGRLHVRELIVEQEQRPIVAQEQTPPQESG